MTHDEDDEPLGPLGGPPPDPTQREWRHPSEIAAAAAAAARGDRPLDDPLPRRLSTSGLIIGGSTGLAACLVVVALLRPVGSDQLQASLTSVAPTTTLLPIESSTTTSPTTTLSDVATTIPAADAATTTRRKPPAERTPNPAFLRQTDAVQSSLVTIYSSTGAEPLASGVHLDGRIITSAAAISGHDLLNVHHRGLWTSAHVVGVDRFSDVAVVRLAGTTGPVEDTATEGEADPGDHAEDEPSTTSEWTAPEHGTSVGIVTALGAEMGEVVKSEWKAELRNGHHAIGTILTSIRMDDDMIGAVLIDDRGVAIGLVVDSEGSLAAATPLTTAQSVARRLEQSGWARELWLGVEGIDVNPGVEIVAITPGSPAEDAGLMVGDIMHRIGDHPILDMATLVEALQSMVAGETSMVWIERGNTALTTVLELRDYEEHALSESVSG